MTRIKSSPSPSLHSAATLPCPAALQPARQTARLPVTELNRPSVVKLGVKPTCSQRVCNWIISSSNDRTNVSSCRLFTCRQGLIQYFGCKLREKLIQYFGCKCIQRLIQYFGCKLRGQTHKFVPQARRAAADVDGFGVSGFEYGCVSVKEE